jgi:hypothetical protein
MIEENTEKNCNNMFVAFLEDTTGVGDIGNELSREALHRSP